MINVTDLLNKNALLEKSTQDFIECYKAQLRMAGIPADSDAEKLIIACLGSAAKAWIQKVKYNKALYGRKN